MAKVESIKCPECGAPLHFKKEQEFCFCSHCGHQVYKEDVHYDRNMDYKEHKLDVDKELELAKLNNEQHESRTLVLMFIIVAIMFIAFMIFGTMH